ncbi:enhancer of rudimentary homolog [Diospyros lotus]|uniref:enhancer of rudimentary homolog n=1 Tax=Diospyros lotus TaxID=55363 RepID=UPI00224E831D|nr:enhancer of rudimentary homolog [Diospyros lotus]
MQNPNSLYLFLSLSFDTESLSFDSELMANRHTIILMQTSQNRATRTFMDYDSINQAMEGICRLYERKLKELNPAIRNFNYDISDLYNFVDGLTDMSALVSLSLSLSLHSTHTHTHTHKH